MRVNFNAADKNGFSLTELLVVFAVIAILSSGLVIYNRVAERQIIIFKEQAKITSAVQKAKSLALGTFAKEETPCGYGVHFAEPDKIIIFKEISPSGDRNCSDADNIYTSNNESFEELKLDKVIKFSGLELSDIVFIPPDPKVIINGSDSKDEALIKIKTTDNKGEKIIKVTNAGQITAQ
jgi:prepilin-type N-terminal cleavage/methylation domain-containing protein